MKLIYEKSIAPHLLAGPDARRVGCLQHLRTAEGNFQDNQKIAERNKTTENYTAPPNTGQEKEEAARYQASQKYIE